MKRIAIVCLLLTAAPAAAQDTPLTEILLPGEGWQPLTGHDFKSISALAADPLGNLYVADSLAKQIVLVGLDGKATVFAGTSAAVHGLAFHEGRLLGCQPEKGRIVNIQAQGKETVVAGDLPGVQDLVVTRTGNIYCTVPGEHAVYLIGRDGSKRVVDQGLKKPTGLTLWRGQGSLVVAEGDGAHLWAFRIKKDGSLDGKERYYPLRVRRGQTSGALGLTIDALGRVYATSSEGVQIFDPTGRLSGVLLRPQREAHVAVAFADKDLQSLYLACGNKLYSRKTKAKGVK